MFKIGYFQVGVDMHKWLAGDVNHTYEAWKKRSCHSLKEVKSAQLNKVNDFALLIK